ncbi:ATP-binding protein [Tropicimonas sp. S265A]|uniref:ATP-binding protein n=1 Tax=Tropicimonas sp. S265A TaxID=3415134 RepID=UPI003C7A00A6
MLFEGLDEIVAALPIPSFVVDVSARIKLANAPARTLFGDDFIDRNYITRLRQPALVSAIETCARDGTRVVTKYTLSGQGTDRIYEATVSRLELGRAVLVCLEDKTPMHEAGMMRRDFVANVSHELRTPLTALLGFIDTLRGPARNDSVAIERFLGMMAREAQRMNRLVGDLLSLSRVEFSERQVPHARVRLSEVLAAARSSIAEQPDRDRIVFDPPTFPEADVTGDADQLRQVFNNLLENALKYGRAGSKVTVSLSEGDSDIYLRCPFYQVSVQDEGEGIAQHHIPRLTERFYRVDDHRSRELGGTGLGLAIVKHIIHRHRGRLDVTSTKGVGSRFSVILRKL